MAIKVNQQLTSKSGITIPSGAIVAYQTIFPPLSKKAILKLYIYASESDLDEGKEPLFEIDEFPTTFAHTFLKSELISLDFSQFESIVLTFIENYIGNGTCSLIDKLPEDGSPS